MLMVGMLKANAINPDTTADSVVIDTGDVEHGRYYTSPYLKDISDVLPKSRPRWKRIRFSGWRGGLAIALAFASLVLLFNVTLAVVTVMRWHSRDNIVTAYTGDCVVVGRWTMAAQFGINLLSSLLLGASNYCMQRLVSPTRKEIDIAHARRKWLDIGVSGLRNLSAISRGRVLIWALLAMTSIPLHFLYNSLIFGTTASNEVYFLQVDTGFFSDRQSWNLDLYENAPHTESLNASYPSYNSSWDNFITRIQEPLLSYKFSDPTLFENLTRAECVSRYSSTFIHAGNRFDVLNVNKGTGADNSLYKLSKGISGSVFDVSGAFSGDYCLSQKVPSRCQVQMSQTILYIVIACNLSKCGLMILTLWRMNDPTIVTIGDAIECFIQTPDTTTKNLCLMSTRTVNALWSKSRTIHGQKFQPRPKDPWFYACSKRRWWLSYILYLCAVVAAAALLVALRKHMTHNNFGAVNTDALLNIELPYARISMLPNILLVNLPQVTVSFLYLTYNGLFTAMLANREWSRYAVKRAPLRVTVPSPGQRSTYFLQLPYTFGIPILLASSFLHWLISQSLFLVRLVWYDMDGVVKDIKDVGGGYNVLGADSNGVITGVGYSDYAILASVVWGLILAIVGLNVGWWFTYPSTMPLGGTNSAVISAACHIQHKTSDKMLIEEVVKKPLKWGVTVVECANEVGHCSFSSGEVTEPIVGHLYAGLSTTTLGS